MSCKSISCNIRSYLIEGNTATIATNERVKINYANGTSETKEYNWIYEAVKADSGFQLATIKEE
ncbi:TcaA NTF2-like domain-containing protein [Bacillus testis]|uniref:TcaA NTF2-like domain-containing protein n=1 Tax=Bacillus testis TaxID=1622072 RepID=UPI0036F27F17